MIEVKQDNSIHVSEFVPEKLSQAINNPDNKRVEVVPNKELDGRLKELTFEQQLHQALHNTEMPKDKGEVAAALVGNRYNSNDGSYYVDNKNVVTMKRSKKQYQIMPNGAWVRI